MKITKEQAQELFSKLGVQDVQLVETKEEADELNPDEILNGFLSAKEPVLRQKFETEVLPEKLKEAAGKFGGNLKNYIRKASDNTIKTSDLEGKTDEEAILLLKEYLHKSKDDSTEQVRTQLKDQIAKHAEEMERLKNEYDGKFTEQTQKFEQVNINGAYSEIIKQIPLLGEDEKAKIETLAHAVSAKYVPKWNEEKKAVELRLKENPDQLAIDGNNLVDIKGFAEKYFGSLGMIKKDTSNENATDHIERGNGAGKSSDLGNPGSGLPFANLMEDQG